MTIRNRLILLLAVPLVALVVVGAFGFAQQSRDSELHEVAQESMESVIALDELGRAIGIERLEYASGLGGARLQDIREATDTVRNEVQATADAEIVATADEVERDLRAARQSPRTLALELYEEALGEIDTAITNASAAGYSPDALTAVRGLARARVAADSSEAAWIEYFAISRVDNAVLAETAQTFARVDANTELAAGVSLSDAETFLYRAPTASAAAVELGQLQSVALRDLTEGEIRTLNSTEVYNTLRTNRAEWDAAAEQGAAFLLDDVTGQADVTDSDRSLFTLLAALAVFLLAALVFIISRSIVGPIRRLITEAEDISVRRLPAAVAKLRNVGASDELPELKPIPREADDEIGSLVDAFNNVQSRAFSIATDQAKSRRNVAEMFVSLGRRNQQLNHRMLGLISELEKNEQNPDVLEGLYRLDHLATRMRRNAESLLVLAGNRSPRQWSRPVAVEDVVRSALAEVENFERVEIGGISEARLRGAVVTDVTHLLAELLDNATNFSDPMSMVTISAQDTLEGLEIEILDHGFGIGVEDLEELNNRIKNPPALDEAPTRLLGLFVVGRLAQQHGIDVELRSKPGVGTVATVWLPGSMIPEETLGAPAPFEPPELAPRVSEDILAELGLDEVDGVAESLEASDLLPAATHEVELAEASVPTAEEMAAALPSFPSVTVDEIPHAQVEVPQAPAPQPMPSAEVELPSANISSDTWPLNATTATDVPGYAAAMPAVSVELPVRELHARTTEAPAPEVPMPTAETPGLPPLPAEPPVPPNGIPPLPEDPAEPTFNVFDQAPPLPGAEAAPVTAPIAVPTPEPAPEPAPAGFGGLPVRSPQATADPSHPGDVLPMPGVEVAGSEEPKPKTRTAGAFAAFASGVSRGLHDVQEDDSTEGGSQ